MSARIVDFSFKTCTLRLEEMRYLNSDDSSQRDQVLALEILWESVNIDLDAFQKPKAKTIISNLISKATVFLEKKK